MEGSLALRALQLKAYAAAIDALRVSDPLSPNAQHLVESLKKTFKISEPRHCAEVRRACSNSELRKVEQKVRGCDSSTAWLRRVRRTVPATAEPFGMATIAQRKLADDILKKIEKTRTKPKVPLALPQEDTAANDLPVVEIPSIRSNFEPLANDETRIKLPGGTVIRIGEEKPDSSSSKPGRKRKGEIVIKEVIEAKVPTIRPKRDRKLPKRFQRSPNKCTQKVKKAVSRLRKQLNVDRARSKDEVKEEKIEAKTEPVQLSTIVKTEPQTGAIIIQQNGRRLSHKSDKSENSTLPSVIIKSATPLAIPVPVTCSSSKGAPTSVIQSPPVAQSCTIVTLPVTQPLRRSNPSTPFMMNDILGGGGGGPPIAPKGTAVILPNTAASRPAGGSIIKTLPEIAPSRVGGTPEARRTPTRPEPSPVASSSRPSSVGHQRQSTKPTPHSSLDLPISYSRGQVTPPTGRLSAADHHSLRQLSPIPQPRQAPMRIVPMSHSTQFPQAFTLHQSGAAILAPNPHELHRASVLHSSLDQSSQLLRPPMHQLRMSQPMMSNMNQTLQPLLHGSTMGLLNPNLNVKLQNGTNYYALDRKLNSNNR